MVFGEHCVLVRSDVAAPVLIMMEFFSFTRLLTASATPEFSTSMKMSTFSTSTHCRAMLTAMSGLFWWSAEIRSIFQPLPVMPESSIAIWAAKVEPVPPRSE